MNDEEQSHSRINILNPRAEHAPNSYWNCVLLLSKHQNAVPLDTLYTDGNC